MLGSGLSVSLGRVVLLCFCNKVLQYFTDFVFFCVASSCAQAISGHSCQRLIVCVFGFRRLGQDSSPVAMIFTLQRRFSRQRQRQQSSSRLHKVLISLHDSHYRLRLLLRSSLDDRCVIFFRRSLSSYMIASSLQFVYQSTASDLCTSLFQYLQIMSPQSN